MTFALKRSFYSDSISAFLVESPAAALGKLAKGSAFSIEATQRDAWLEEITFLQTALPKWQDRGKIYFEFSIPRLGKRIDVLLVIDHVIFVLEFKVGALQSTKAAKDQVWDYALDLKNFHETSHHQIVCPILIVTGGTISESQVEWAWHEDGCLAPVATNKEGFPPTH